MLYNNKGYTIEIPDELYWSMSDEEFNEYIDTKFIESFNCKDNSTLSGFPQEKEFDIPEE
jgi:hypothetical protein